MLRKQEEEKLSDREIAERMDRALQRSFKMPPTPQKEIAGKSGRQPRKSKAAEKGQEKP